MWLEASILIWGPLVAVWGAWSIRKSAARAAAIRDLQSRVAELEAQLNSAPRRKVAA